MKRFLNGLVFTVGFTLGWLVIYVMGYYLVRLLQG